ncbi:hypothetical protein Hdeb2414_s0020g00557941 [Helianthus debilis subsp. tardiflorus]
MDCGIFYGCYVFWKWYLSNYHPFLHHKQELNMLEMKTSCQTQMYNKHTFIDLWNDDYDEDSPLPPSTNERGKSPLIGPDVHEGFLYLFLIF